MTEDEGTFAVPGDESHESETLSQDEGGEAAGEQPPWEPTSPDPAGR